ncbi:hypothetical protein P154DRAFT_519375 [Amniculicola lignicola CBS 123094]|uniref:Uncharacterized protein n=1 Tax=Amniculicola lignicola CBS 123094 TaxID=1392246 RepID=A0A6A5WU97_9PLEO|nr:hypothetical protein P154DRAFT_519375 [Amniculicola lignicola CBS 123094]
MAEASTPREPRTPSLQRPAMVSQRRPNTTAGARLDRGWPRPGSRDPQNRLACPLLFRGARCVLRR